MTRYIVAKANKTAMAFVAKVERERDGWTIIRRCASYGEACSYRDAYNCDAFGFTNA